MRHDASIDSSRTFQPWRGCPSVLWVTLALLFAGCATVHPWEREAHARPIMQVNPQPGATALQQHVYDYREAATGGYSASGGSGCGCN